MNEGVVLLLFVLVGSSVAIFFTSSKQNDYPRIGRRSFYTSSKENTYPRIGRRSLEHTHSKQRHALMTKRAMFTASNENSYPRIGRGVFTSSGSGNSFPRVGRRKSPPLDVVNGERARSHVFDNIANTEASSLVHLQPQSASTNWDLNGDGIISRKEFIESFLQGRKRRK